MSACMKLRVLEEWLQGLEEFEKPKVVLEQYATPPHIASCMMHTMQDVPEPSIECVDSCELPKLNGKRVVDIHQFFSQINQIYSHKSMFGCTGTNIEYVKELKTLYEDIEGKAVCDLGAGCGMLSSGAALLQASFVTGLEIDPDALEIFSKNMDDLEVTNVDAVLINILNGPSERFYKQFDTVVMNPPFGTKNNSGVDVEFLNMASKLSISSVYSLHKTSTRSFIMKKSKELGFEPKVVAELRYNLPSSYKFHKKSSVDIAVDFWRFKVLDTS